MYATSYLMCNNQGVSIQESEVRSFGDFIGKRLTYWPWLLILCSSLALRCQDADYGDCAL
jgi:hypothetical protein